MRCPTTISNEHGRLLALADYGLSPEVGLPTLEPVVEIAAKLFNAPAAAVNMIGEHRVFFAASIGIGDCDMSRDVSFCAHAITQDGVMVVEDALLDLRFHDNPLVTGPNPIRFYAGVPLIAPSGHALGALCIVDCEPRPAFTDQDRARLKELAKLAADQLELRRLEVSSTRQLAEFEQSAKISRLAAFSVDRSGEITSWNSAAAALFGHSPAAVIGRSFHMLVPPEQWPELSCLLGSSTGEGHTCPAVAACLGIKADGSLFPMQLRISRSDRSTARHFSIVAEDVSERQGAEETLQRLIDLDSLTGLANRNVLHQRVSEALQNHKNVALVMADLDGFKDINNTLGHRTGDAVLGEVANRLRRCALEGDLIARVGGDEFAVLLLSDSTPFAAALFSKALIAALAEPMAIDAHEVRVSASCGVAESRAGADAEQLIGDAELALFQAKRGGKASSFTFVPALRSEAVARRMYDEELHRAVERGELRLFYQPQVRLSDGQLTGAEALLRWQHPQRQLLQPAAFLPALERSPLAARVGEWILDTACAQASYWRRMHPDFQMCVNLFAAQLRTGNLAATVANALAAHGLPPSALELEITENIALADESLVLPQLRAVRELGVDLAFDDFGTGYASLNMLKDYPITHIKIDKGFIQAMQESAHDRAIVTSVLELAKALQFGVIAEGVEADGQHEFLRSRRCDVGQGYLFGRPMPAEIFEEKFALVRECLAS